MNTFIEFKIGQVVKIEDYKKMDWVEFDQFLRQKPRPSHLHEVIQGQCIPYFDFDPVYNSEEELQMMRVPIITMAYNAVQKQYPGANVIVGESCGRSSKKQAWTASARFLVRGAGFYNSPVDMKAVAEQLAQKVEGFDLGVYHERKTMRGFFMVKEADPNRPVNRVHPEKGKLTPCKQDPDGNISLLKENWMDYFITNTKNEKKCLSIEKKKEKPRKEKKVVDSDSDDDEPKRKNKKKKVESDSESESDSDSDDEEEAFDCKGWNYERAKAVIKRLNDDRADTHRKRILGITSIAHLARGLRKTKEFKKLARLFAKKDPDYDEDKTDKEYEKQCKSRAKGKVRTFASLIADANEDNPEDEEAEQVEDSLDKKPELTFYDQRHELRKRKASLNEWKRWIMGCIRFCSRKGEEIWYQHSTDGWYQIENKSNFPFSTLSSGLKLPYLGTDLAEVLQDFKDSYVFQKWCSIEGAEWYPFYGQSDRPDIINTWTGWGRTVKGPGTVTENVRRFRDHILMLFNEKNGRAIEPNQQPGNYEIDGLSTKLRNPRVRGKLIMGYEPYGGAGKTCLEENIMNVFAGSAAKKKELFLATSDTKHFLGQGEAGYNGMIENKPFLFIHEAKEGGKSIVCDEKFKDFLDKTTVQIRHMRQNPYDAPLYAFSFFWSNHKSALKMAGPIKRRTMAQRVSAEKTDDAKYLEEMWAMVNSDEAGQEIFDWLAQREITPGFDLEKQPETDFMRGLTEDAFTLTQSYIVEVSAGRRPIQLEELKGVVRYPRTSLYRDFNVYCQEEGYSQNYIPKSMSWKNELEELGIEIKQLEYQSGRPLCAAFDFDVIEDMLRKFKKDKTWVLPRADEDDVFGEE